MGELSLDYGLCSYKNPYVIKHLTKSLTKQQNTQNISKRTNKGKGKDKALVQALRLCTGRTAHRGSRGIALPFHDHGTRRG